MLCCFNGKGTFCFAPTHEENNYLNLDFGHIYPPQYFDLDAYPTESSICMDIPFVFFSFVFSLGICSCHIVSQSVLGEPHICFVRN